MLTCAWEELSLIARKGRERENHHEKVRNTVEVAHPNPRTSHQTDKAPLTPGSNKGDAACQHKTDGPLPIKPEDGWWWWWWWKEDTVLEDSGQLRKLRLTTAPFYLPLWKFYNTTRVTATNSRKTQSFILLACGDRSNHRPETSRRRMGETFEIKYFESVLRLRRMTMRLYED